MRPSKAEQDAMRSNIDAVIDRHVEMTKWLWQHCGRSRVEHEFWWQVYIGIVHEAWKSWLVTQRV